MGFSGRASRCSGECWQALDVGLISVSALLSEVGCLEPGVECNHDENDTPPRVTARKIGAELVEKQYTLMSTSSGMNVQWFAAHVHTPQIRPVPVARDLRRLQIFVRSLVFAMLRQYLFFLLLFICKT